MTNTTFKETTLRPTSAWPFLFAFLAMFFGGIACAIRFNPGFLVMLPFAIMILPGLFVVNPNESRVLTLLGNYKGSVHKEGYYWVNPLTNKRKISLKAHNFNSETLKVNDLAGNPIEIAAVVVWRVMDTAKAAFEVEDYNDFVEVQSETALRSMASSHPYDDGLNEEVETTLRGSSKEVSEELQETLQRRLETAGIQIIEARLSHLAYAPEIASAMLQRQQASAVIAARTKIVEGAVSMVEMALEQLEDGKIAELDDERKASLVGNLLVVLCGGQAPTPVMNTGTLYN